MRAMRAEQFSGYEALKLAELPKPTVTDGKVRVRITAAGVTPLDHTILFGNFTSSCEINPTTLGRAYSERGINDNNKGDSAGFAGHGNQCIGRERLFHRGDHSSAIPRPCRIRSNGGVVAIGDVRV